MAKEHDSKSLAASPVKERKSAPSSAATAVNFLLYVLCVASLGTAVYSNIRLRTYDERIKALESIVYATSEPQLHGLRFPVAAPETSRSIYMNSAAQVGESQINNNNNKINHNNINNNVLYYDNVNSDAMNNKSAEQEKENGNSASEDLLQRLQHQVAGIQRRLRRDVSQLQLIRPQRQVPDCICPAGE